MDWHALFRRHADVLAGLAAWFIVAQIVGRLVSPEWGIVTLGLSVAAGTLAYFVVQRRFPGARE